MLWQSKKDALAELPTVLPNRAHGPRIANAGKVRIVVEISRKEARRTRPHCLQLTVELVRVAGLRSSMHGLNPSIANAFQCSSLERKMTLRFKTHKADAIRKTTPQK